MTTLDERSHSFVVKIWEERRDVEGAVPMWRGSVEDVKTGARHYFSSLGDLSNYLNRHSGMSRSSVDGPATDPALMAAPRWRDRLLRRLRRRQEP